MNSRSDNNEHQKIEVELGSRSLFIEECQLDTLLEALTEMNNLASDGKALLNVGLHESAPKLNPQNEAEMIDKT
jgi:hypothetical protein